MRSILDRVADRQSAEEFSPQTIQEFFALRLAQKLDNAAAALHYVQLLDRYSEMQLLAAFRRTRQAAPLSAELPAVFHRELARRCGNGRNGQFAPYLCAIKVERRSVSVAVFAGRNLDY